MGGTLIKGGAARSAHTRSGILGAVLAGGLLAFPGAPAAAEEPERVIGLDAQSDLTLTIYNQDLALVSERRRIALEAGVHRLALAGVSRQLRPETLILDGAGLVLVEQGFDGEVMTPQRLLERRIGERVWVRRVDREGGTLDYVAGILAGAAAQPLVRIGDKLEVVPLERIAFDADVEDLRAQATATAVLESAEAGERELHLTYLTGGLSWQADYVAELDPEERQIRFNALVTLRNHSGTTFRDAALRLVAGEVARDVPMPPVAPMPMVAATAEGMAAKRDLSEQAFADQHLYSLDRRITLADQEIKQLALLTAAAVPVTKEYRLEGLVNVYQGAGRIDPLQAEVRLEFGNDEAAGLGRPLPAGVVRVYQTPAGEATVFLGEDRIDHSAKGADLRLTVGRAFDVSGKARQTAFERLSDRSFEAAQEIVVMNAKDRPVQVKVVGHLPGDWRMLEESTPHQAETANRVVWTLDVAAEGTTALTYRVRVTQR